MLAELFTEKGGDGVEWDVMEFSEALWSLVAAAWQHLQVLYGQWQELGDSLGAILAGAIGFFATFYYSLNKNKDAEARTDSQSQG